MARRLIGDEFGAVVHRGERVLSCDLDGDGAWVLAVDDGTRTTVRFSRGLEVVMRENHGSLKVALLDPEQAFVIVPRTDHHVPNAWVVGSGGPRRKFFAGDAVQDVIAASADEVVLTYFDEGFGEPVSEEGVAVFGSDGRLRRGWVSSGG